MLAPQLVDGVEAVVLWNRGGRTIGEYRQLLLESASGEYVSFVDDDDRLPGFFVERIVEALESRPDYVGFKVAVDDQSERPISYKYRRYVAYHSLRYDRWHQRGNRFFRHVSHLNPIRRDIALRAPFDGWRGEDHIWADQIRQHVHTETWIDDTLYFYDFAQERSIRSGRQVDRSRVSRPALPAGFRYHPDSEE